MAEKLDWLKNGIAQHAKSKSERNEETTALAQAAREYSEELTVANGDQAQAKTAFVKRRNRAKSKNSKPDLSRKKH